MAIFAGRGTGEARESGRFGRLSIWGSPLIWGSRFGLLLGFFGLALGSERGTLLGRDFG